MCIDLLRSVSVVCDVCVCFVSMCMFISFPFSKSKQRRIFVYVFVYVFVYIFVYVFVYVSFEMCVYLLQVVSVMCDVYVCFVCVFRFLL